MSPDNLDIQRPPRGESQLQERLEAVAKEWQRTFDAVASAILILDSGNRILRMNRSAMKLTGGDYTESLGKEVAAAGDGEPWRTLGELAAEARTSGMPINRQVKDEAGGRSWDLAVTLTAPQALGETTTIAHARDITELVALQESLRHSEVMSAMGSLVAGVAHEVRNPLFAISAIVDAFEVRFGEREEFSEIEEYLRVLRGEIERLNRLMNELLSYGKPVEVRSVSETLGSVIRESAGSCAPLAEQAGVEIVEEIDEDLPRIRMERDRLGQVFQNLIENGIQHSPQGASVWVEARKVEDWIECKIVDSGPGFRPEDLSHVFEPFFSRRKAGIGLGLSIVQRVIGEHGGEIIAANNETEGAMVTVRLPWVEE